MTGSEIVAASKVVGAVANKALDQDKQTKEDLRSIARDSKEMEAAARTYATRVAVKERIKLKLYEPFARMVGVSKAYFEDKFPEEMAQKTAAIPEEHLVTPLASVAVPALQGLSYTFQEADLKTLYLNLLATASDDRRANEAHPAFAEVIKQLSSREVQGLDVVLKDRQVTIARVRHRINGGSRTLLSHLVPFTENGHPVVEPDIPIWVDNWARLGLVEPDYLEYQLGEKTYAWVTERPEYQHFVKEYGDDSVHFDKGVLRRTDFGERFFKAVTPQVSPSDRT